MIHSNIVSPDNFLLTLVRNNVPYFIQSSSCLSHTWFTVLPIYKIYRESALIHRSYAPSPNCGNLIKFHLFFYLLLNQSMYKNKHELMYKNVQIHRKISYGFNSPLQHTYSSSQFKWLELLVGQWLQNTLCPLHKERCLLSNCFKRAEPV